MTRVRVPAPPQNFRCLCTGERGLGQKTGKALHFKSTMFHRVIPGFMMQGGDFSAMNGTGGESIYGGKFEDEDLSLLHNSAGILSMANSGKNANGVTWPLARSASTAHAHARARSRCRLAVLHHI